MFVRECACVCVCVCVCACVCFNMFVLVCVIAFTKNPDLLYIIMGIKIKS